MSGTSIKKQALLIGINGYEILPQLKYARQDAEAVAQSLKYNYCFSDNEITLLSDVQSGVFKPSNRSRILSQLENLTNQDLDLFIFGFWGHGVVRNGKRYLCPIDISQDAVEEQGVLFDDLMSKLTKIRAKNTCLILDCCQSVYDGERGKVETFTSADQDAIENAARNIIYNRQKNKPEFQSNVAILNSCKQGQAAYEWDNRKHGIFTAHLLDAMNRRYDTVSKIVSYVSKNVEKTAKDLGKQQTPLCSLEGDIHLPVDTKSAPLVTGDVFVSYRHSNADLVAPIEEELKNRGISYFIDRVGVDYTMEYASALAQAVDECRVLLFVWTQDADVSLDILREVSMALAYNKRVLPYKIGNFDVKEHRSLFYHLSPISRFEVHEQTPETVMKLIDQVQRAMTDETYQQYSFNIPVNSADAVIEKPEIGHINIHIKPTIIEQQQQQIQYDTITLPPKPEELLRIPAENEALRDAIEQLKSFTHESLVQANIALQQTEAQLELWKKRRKERWKDLPKKTRESWENIIVNNPDCLDDDVIQQGSMSNPQYLELVEKFQCGKKYQQAKMELERVKRERKSKCDEVIERFQQQIERNKIRYNDCLNGFLKKVLLTILSVMKGYDDVDAKYPEDEILKPLYQLDKYGLGWKASDEKIQARLLWESERPCVVSKRKWDNLKRITISSFLFLIEFLIGFSLLVLGGYLFNGAYCVSQEQYPFFIHIFYMTGASSSFLIGLPLCISAVLIWIGFNLNELKFFLIKSLYSLAFVSMLTLGITFWYFLDHTSGLDDNGYFAGDLGVGASFFSAAVYLICWLVNEIDSFIAGEEYYVPFHSLGVIVFFFSGGLLLYFNLPFPMMIPLFVAIHSVFLGLLLAILPFTKFMRDLKK